MDQIIVRNALEFSVSASLRDQRNSSRDAPAVAATSIAAASIANQMPQQYRLDCVDIVKSYRPETAPPLLQAFKDEMAAQHGLAQLFQALDSGDFCNLPTPEALTLDLQNLCKVDLLSDKQFVLDTLQSISGHIPRLWSEPVTAHAGVVNLAQSSHVLLRALGQIADEEVSTVGQMRLECLTQIHNLVANATEGVEPIAHLTQTRDFLAIKHNQLAQAIADVSEWGRPALQTTAFEFRDNLEVVMIAVQQNGLSLRFASEALKNIKPLVMAAVQESGHALEFASPELRNNREVVMAAIQNWGHALAFASDELKSDPDLVMTAVENWGRALEFASPALQNNFQIVTTAVQESAFALEFAIPDLQNNPQLVLSIVRIDGRALRFASAELRNNQQIVLAAVQQDGNALQFADPEMQNNLEVVRTAVRQDPGAFYFAGSHMRNVPQIARDFFNAPYQASRRNANFN